MTVYLLHFEQRLYHAGHYIGSARDLERRLQQHRSGQGARLMQVLQEEGIPWHVARTWEGGYSLEKYLKRQKNGPRFCPICQGRHLMATKKPPTHCEKYGHLWTPSTSEGYEVCAQMIASSSGKLIPCGAARRKPIPGNGVPQRLLSQPQKAVPLTQQSTLWNN